jgi:hypothetical protein
MNLVFSGMFSWRLGCGVCGDSLDKGHPSAYLVYIGRRIGVPLVISSMGRLMAYPKGRLTAYLYCHFTYLLFVYRTPHGVPLILFPSVIKLRPSLHAQALNS